MDNASRRGAGEMLAAAPGRRPPMRRMHRVLCGAIETLLLWQERRRQRGMLATLSDQLLKDIGVTRLEVTGRRNKSPWRA